MAEAYNYKALNNHDSGVELPGGDTTRADSGSVVPAQKVALVHDWLTGMRGGEMVLQEFCLMFPEADLFTIAHLKGSVSPVIEKRRIFESPLVKLPRGRQHFRALLPFFPWAVESFDLKGYDLVISSSHCAAKGVIPTPDALHLSYVHTPMRYVWDIRSDYLGPDHLGSLARFISGWASHYLRTWDVVSTARVDKIVANSQHVARRIKKYYRRDAEVIYPPVNVEKFRVSEGHRDYFLVVSALVPYKRVDLAISACERLGVRLVIAGDGSEKPKLERMAGSKTEFVGPLPQEELHHYYQGAIALLHPGEEDFGIVPVEAQACGRPVIAYGRGGTTETVIGEGDRPTGVFFFEHTVESLTETIRNFDPGKFSPEAARKNAERFGRERFIREITAALRSAWQELKG